MAGPGGMNLTAILDSAYKFQDPTAVSPYNKGVMLGVISSMMALSILVVGLRFFVRMRTRTRIGADDYTILVALVISLGTGVIDLVGAVYGNIGSHLPLGPEGQLVHNSVLTTFEKCRYANIVLSTANLGLVKISVILFYRRLFSVASFKLISTISVVCVAIYTVVMTSAMLAQCNPLHVFWDLFELEYGDKCLPVQIWYLALAWSDFALDILVLSLPIPTVFMLKMSWRKRIGVLDILMLYAVVLGSGIGRIVSFSQVINQTAANPFIFFFDTTWWTAGPMFWAFAEGSVAIIGASLPTLAPLWTQTTKTTASKAAAYYGSRSSKVLDSDPSRSQPRGTDDIDMEPMSPAQPSFAPGKNYDARDRTFYVDTCTCHERGKNTIHVQQTFGPSRNDRPF